MNRASHKPLSGTLIQVNRPPAGARATLKSRAVQGFQRLSSKALVMTLTELMAIAAPANTGFR